MHFEKHLKKYIIQYNNSIGNNNNKVNELYSLFHHGCYLAVKIVSNILKKAEGQKFEKE